MYTFIIHVPPNKNAQKFADKISRCFNIFDNFSEHSHALRIILCQFANKVHAYAITESFARMFVFYFVVINNRLLSVQKRTLKCGANCFNLNDFRMFGLKQQLEYLFRVDQRFYFKLQISIFQAS